MHLQDEHHYAEQPDGEGSVENQKQVDAQQTFGFDEGRDEAQREEELEIVVPVIVSNFRVGKYLVTKIQVSDGAVKDEHHELVLVVGPDAVTQEEAVVILSQDAAVAQRTVVRLLALENVAFATEIQVAVFDFGAPVGVAGAVHNDPVDGDLSVDVGSEEGRRCVTRSVD